MVWRWQVVADLVRPLEPTLGAEIGVKEGRFISYLLRVFPGLLMYAVDPWEEQPGANEDYIGWDFRVIYEQYRTAVAPMYGRVRELKRYSVDAAYCVPDAALDFAFIDAQHDYQSVRQDIDAWAPKIRPGGMLLGHDYEPRFSGVCDAVDEAFNGRNGVADNSVWYVKC